MFVLSLLSHFSSLTSPPSITPELELPVLLSSASPNADKQWAQFKVKSGAGLLQRQSTLQELPDTRFGTCGKRAEGGSQTKSMIGREFQLSTNCVRSAQPASTTTPEKVCSATLTQLESQLLSASAPVSASASVSESGSVSLYMSPSSCNQSHPLTAAR